MKQKEKSSGTKHADRNEKLTWFDKLSSMKKDLVCVGALLLMIYILFFQVIFSGYIFSDEADTAAQESWSSALGHLWTTENIEPIWIPYVFSGMPVIGALLFPRDVNYLEIVFRFICKILFPAANPWFVPHFFLAGLGMYLLARYLRFTPLPSLFGAIVLMLNPYFIGLPQIGHGSKLAVFSTLPFVFLVTLKLFETKKVLYLGLLGVLMGWMHLLRHPQIAFYILLVGGVYLLYEIVTDIKKKKPAEAGIKTITFILAVVIGFSIYAYEFLPTQEYAKFSIRGGSGDGKITSGLTYDYATSWSLHPLEIATYVVPSFFGFSSSVTSDWQGEQRPLPLYWGWMPFSDGPPYIGLLPVLLSMIALIFRRTAMTWFLLVLSVVVFLISFGNHFGILYNLLFYYLPFFNKFRAPSMILFLIPFAFGLLALYGMSFLMELPSRAKEFNVPVFRKRVMTILGILGGILVIGFVAKGAVYGFLSDFMFVGQGDVQKYGQDVVNLFKEKRFDLLWGDYVKMTLFAAVFLYAIVMTIDRKISKTMFAVICTILTIIDLLILDVKYINLKPASALTERFQPDATVQFLKADSSIYRIYPLGDLFLDNTYMYHFVTSIGGYSPAKLKIYQELIDSTFFRGSDPKFPLNMNVVNMLNTKYLMAPGRLPENKLVLVNTDQAKGIITYRNPDCFPRAWFAEGAVVASSKSDVFRRLNDPNWNPRITAVIEKELSTQVTRSDSSTATIVKFGAHEISMQTYTSGTSLLVLSEVYYPAGWKAYIDGAETEIYKTDYVLRSVAVPSGTHTIEFRFEPTTLEAGYTISQIGWGVAIVLILIGGLQFPSVRTRLGMNKKGVDPPVSAESKI